MSKAAEATALQRKIFSRWVNQKIQSKGKKITDVVNDFKNGDMLIYLLEALSEKQFQNWKKIQTGSRMKQIDACGQALQFLGECGVEMKTKTSAENLVDGTELPVMGLVWAIMLKFMKLDDDEEEGPSMTFADALKMWIANQVAHPYELKVDNWTKSFHDGRVFCALINKYRPKLLDYSKTSGNAASNLKLAFAAAETYFGLEQYLQITDIEKLDDKSMVVYASEYYYGIAQQRKVDLAAKRVSQLIEFTKENDSLKVEYTKRSTALRTRIDAVLPVLSDATIENTMAGAVRRLQLFNDYRKNDKAFLFSETFATDSIHQTLSRRLLSRKRPAFVPPKGCSVPEIAEKIKEIEKREASQNVALHEELNRQIKLAKIFEQFSGKLNELDAWVGVSRAYLDQQVEILSVGAAQFALKQLESFCAAYAGHAASLPNVDEWAKELISNKFEFSAKVNERQSQVHADFTELKKKSDHKKLVHEDDLAREIVKAKVRGLNDDHVSSFDKLAKFMATCKEALSRKEVVKSIKDAQLHLNLTNALHIHREALTANIPPLKAIGHEILTTEYKGEFSRWKFEHPEQVTKRESDVEGGFAQLKEIGAEKLLVLQDDLDREKFRENVRQWNENHKLMDNRLQVWIGKSKTYLAKKEPVDSIENAQDNLVVHRGYLETEKAMEANDVQALLAQGKAILDAKYETKYSKYTFAPPEEVRNREGAVLQSFKELNAASALKLEILEDDLAREQFRFRVNKMNEQHVRQYTSLEAWIVKSKAYVDTKEPVDSVEQAEDNLVIIRAYLEGQKLMEEGEVKGLLHLGQQILTARYTTKHSTWQFKTPQEVQTREGFVNDSFTYLHKTSAHKLAVLEDDLTREQFRFKVNKWNEQHVREHKSLEGWIGESKAYADKKEPVNSVEQAQDNLVVIRAYLASQKLKQDGAVKSLLRLGNDILSARYKTQYSEWQFKTPDEVKTRETFVNESFVYLVRTSDHKLKVLEDDLAREEFKFKLHLWDDQHKDGHSKLHAWIDVQKAYLAVVEPFDSIADAEKNLKVLAAHVEDMNDVTKINAATFHKLGKDILDAKYETTLSNWVWEDKPAVQGRLDYVTKSWQELHASSAAKRTKLDADLKKELRKEELRTQWAKYTDEASAVCRDNCVSAPNTMFGFNLEEVEAFAAKLAAMDAKINTQVQDLEKKYTPVWKEMVELGVRTAENPYSKLTPEDMSRMTGQLASALAQRQERFRIELEKQRGDDKACRELAALADPFAKTIGDSTKAISEAKEGLEQQLELVKRLAPKPTADELKAIQAAQAVVDQRKVIFNRHTLNNGPDCAIQFKQYTEYTATKQTMLANEIEFKALRGLTKDQYVEIKQQFDQFDRDKSGFLDKREFRSCLYSVGEERGKKEIDAILAKMGNGDPNKVKISYDGYKEFMIEQLGDTDTEEQLIKGFQLMNRMETSCQWNVLAHIMEQHHLDYIKGTHGGDYTAWVKSVFAR